MLYGAQTDGPLQTQYTSHKNILEINTIYLLFCLISLKVTIYISHIHTLTYIRLIVFYFLLCHIK